MRQRSLSVYSYFGSLAGQTFAEGKKNVWSLYTGFRDTEEFNIRDVTLMSQGRHAISILLYCRHDINCENGGGVTGVLPRVLPW